MIAIMQVHISSVHSFTNCLPPSHHSFFTKTTSPCGALTATQQQPGRSNEYPPKKNKKQKRLPKSVRQKMNKKRFRNNSKNNNNNSITQERTETIPSSSYDGYPYDYDDDEDYDTSSDYDSDNDNYDEEDQDLLSSTTTSKHFFSRKTLNDPNFSIAQSSTFQQLCQGASITQPSRIQALSWPTLLSGRNCIVADQTGSGKTLSYIIPLIQRMMDPAVSTNVTSKRGKGSPQILILAPTAELADQIKTVCDKTTSQLDKSIASKVITATGSHSTNIRDQIRMLSSQHVDVLISTPGRIATILRTKNTSLDLSHLQSIVLDEVDVLLIDETFGPQLRTIGAAAPVSAAQFVFVTATLPDEIIESVKREFDNVEVIQGPGLHKIAPNLKEHLVDVSVPSSSNQDLDLCFEFKAKELMKALRANRCKRTLVFCNTVEACRKVENLIRRNDRRGALWCVGAYHNAMTADGRRKNLNVFVRGLRENSDVNHALVCTDRAGRGVDFDSAPVDHVILFDFPKDPA